MKFKLPGYIVTCRWHVVYTAAGTATIKVLVTTATVMCVVSRRCSIWARIRAVLVKAPVRIVEGWERVLRLYATTKFLPIARIPIGAGVVTVVLGSIRIIAGIVAVGMVSIGIIVGAVAMRLVGIRITVCIVGFKTFVVLV